MRRLPAIENTLQVLCNTNDQMWINATLPRPAAKPLQPGLIDEDLPIETNLGRCNFPARQSHLVWRVTAAGNAAHPRRIFANADVIAEPARNLCEPIARLRTQQRHALH